MIHWQHLLHYLSIIIIITIMAKLTHIGTLPNRSIHTHTHKYCMNSPANPQPKMIIYFFEECIPAVSTARSAVTVQFPL